MTSRGHPQHPGMKGKGKREKGRCYKGEIKKDNIIPYRYGYHQY